MMLPFEALVALSFVLWSMTTIQFDITLRAWGLRA
jgi:nitrogen fixation-related uncharacterized protein